MELLQGLRNMVKIDAFDSMSCKELLFFKLFNAGFCCVLV
jgi:hypothetical protein